MTQTIAANVNNNIPGVAPGDIYLDEQGNIAVVYNQEAVLQACAQAAQTVLGEMIYNTTTGIPFFEAVWIGVPNIQQYAASLRSAFLNVGGGGLVTEVVSLITSQNGDVLYYSAIIRTIYGTGTLTGNTSNG